MKFIKTKISRPLIVLPVVLFLMFPPIKLLTTTQISAISGRPANYAAVPYYNCIIHPKEASQRLDWWQQKTFPTIITNYQVRQIANSNDVKHYDTRKLCEDFLFSNVMRTDEVNIVYLLNEHVLAGGALPVKMSLQLETIEPLWTNFFLEMREIGIVNVGGKGIVVVDGKGYSLDYKEALYIGKGKKDVFFHSDNAENPAKYYFLSAPAHEEFPTVKVTLADAKKTHLDASKTFNKCTIYQLFVSPKVKTCQLQMGITELAPGSFRDTMPMQVQDHRMKYYFYFEIPHDQAIFHYMTRPDTNETRHIRVHNEEVVISPNWSIPFTVGKVNYTFIWGMTDGNLDDDEESMSVSQAK